MARGKGEHRCHGEKAAEANGSANGAGQAELAAAAAKSAICHVQMLLPAKRSVIGGTTIAATADAN